MTNHEFSCDFLLHYILQHSLKRQHHLPSPQVRLPLKVSIYKNTVGII